MAINFLMRHRKSMYKWMPFVCSLVWLFGGWGGTASVHAQPNDAAVRFQKPFFAYLGIEGAAVSRLSEARLRYVESQIRKEVEKTRYLFVKMPYGSRRRRVFVRKMVSIVAQRARGVAQMRSEWDSQFQGVLVTADLLRSIQNNSFYYWIELTEAYARRDSGLINYIFKVNIHVHRLVIFDCSSANRQISRDHNDACRNKRMDQFVGFSKTYKVLPVVEEGVSMPNASDAFERSAKNLRVSVANSLVSVPELRLFAPVSRASFNSLDVDLGKAEGLRLNQGFEIYVRHVRGHLIYQGFARIRSIGDNRMEGAGDQRRRVDPNAPLYSTAQPLIGGALRKGMLMYERPQSSGFISIFAGMIPISHPSFARQGGGLLGPSAPIVEGMFLIPSLRIGGGFDISNGIGFNEIYLDLLLEFGIGGTNPDGGFVAPLLVHLGLQKRFYLRRAALSLGIRASGGYLFSDPNSTPLFGGDAMVGFEFMITPGFHMALRGGFRAIFSITGAMSLGPWAMLGGHFHL